MAINTKKTITYIGIGVLLAVIIIAGIFASTSFPGDSTSENLQLGTLFVYLTDAPVELANLNVTLDALYVHNQDESAWIKLDFTEGTDEIYFDLLSLRNINKEIAAAEIPAGNYSKIRFHIKEANASLADDSTIDLTVPPEHIDVIIKFEIEPELARELLIDMQPDSVSVNKNNHLKPILKASILS